jgi:coiled-coil and C2 domain-containing protein 2A
MPPKEVIDFEQNPHD